MVLIIGKKTWVFQKEEKQTTDQYSWNYFVVVAELQMGLFEMAGCLRLYWVRIHAPNQSKH